MSTSITKALADTYFAEKNHIMFPVWDKYDDGQKTAAIAHAKRITTRALGRTVTGLTVVSASGYQPNYAVYEQALFTLENSEAVPNGEQTGPKYRGTRRAVEGEQQPNPYALAPEAAKWLDLQSGATVQISRG